jgi:hypothetical protein
VIINTGHRFSRVPDFASGEGPLLLLSVRCRGRLGRWLAPGRVHGPEGPVLLDGRFGVAEPGSFRRGGCEGLALPGAVLVGDRGVVLVTVSAGELPIEAGGGLFCLVGFADVGADLGVDDLVGDGGGLAAHGVIGPLGAGGLLVVPTSAELVAAGLCGFDLGGSASEAARARGDDPSVAAGREVLDGRRLDQLGTACCDPVSFSPVPGGPLAGFGGGSPVSLVVPLAYVVG